MNDFINGCAVLEKELEDHEVYYWNSMMMMKDWPEKSTRRLKELQWDVTSRFGRERANALRNNLLQGHCTQHIWEGGHKVFYCKRGNTNPIY
jgi:hypothetical protein